MAQLARMEANEHIVPDAHALLNIGRRHAVRQADDILGNLQQIVASARCQERKKQEGAPGER